MEPSECLYLNPAQIHFSQDTISATFQDGTPLGQTLDRLVTMETFVTDIPPITVVKYNDKYFARNNRRLWVFRQLSLMGQCEYIPTILSSELPSGQFTTDTDGHEVVVRGEDGSATLRDFEKLQRDNTVQTLKSMRLGPITPSYRCNVTPRFKGHRKQCCRKQRRRVGAKRNILRGKGGGRVSHDVIRFPGSNDKGHKETREPGLRKSAAFDFGPYATNPARIGFTEQRGMIFGNEVKYGARDEMPIGYHQQPHHHRPELGQFGIGSMLPGYNEQYTGPDPCVRGSMPYVQRSTMIGGTRAHAHFKNEHAGYHTCDARRFGINDYNTQGYRYRETGARWRMTDGPRESWSAEIRPTRNAMYGYQVRPKWASERRNFESLSELRVYGQTQQAEDFAFNRFDSRH